MTDDDDFWNGSAPPLAWGLGLAGLVPFLAGAAAYAVPDLPYAVELQAAFVPYGVIILSFMAAIHWGLAMARTHGGSSIPRQWQLVLSVLPPLWAWGALIVAPRDIGLALTLGFAGLLAFDVYAARNGAAPRWYPSYRVPLTLVVLVCLSVRAAQLG